MRPRWVASQRRVVKLLPSRTRSTAKSIGMRRIAGEDEIAVQRMNRTVGGRRPRRGDERLSHGLPAIDLHGREEAGLWPRKTVWSDLLEIEKREKLAIGAVRPCGRAGQSIWRASSGSMIGMPSRIG